MKINDPSPLIPKDTLMAQTSSWSLYDMMSVIRNYVLLWRFLAFSYEPRHEKTRFLPMRKQRRRLASQLVTAKLISAFVFATRIVQFLPCYLYPNYQVLLRLFRPVCVKPGRKPRRPVFPRQDLKEAGKVRLLVCSL